MKTTYDELAEENPDIFEFHEGMNGGTNARGEETSLMPTKVGTTAILLLG